jgi:hypothetical protein
MVERKRQVSVGFNSHLFSQQKWRVWDDGVGRH